MGSYDAPVVELMCVALNEAWRLVPEKRRSKYRRSEMALRLLEAASEGERDPKKLKEAALGQFELTQPRKVSRRRKAELSNLRLQQRL